MKRMKRITASILCVILCVSLNFNPLAIIASSIINSGIVDRFENLKDNLSLFIDGQLPINAYAEETPTGSNIPMQIPMDVRQNISTYANSTEGATIDDLNNKLSSILTSTNSIKTNMNSNYQTITGIIGYQNGGSLESDLTSIKSALGYDPSISGHSGNVATDLQNIQSKLDELNGNINEMQHNYRVAHLYSMNNMFRDVLYRPYSSEVPYIKDFATVTGEFANVYTGYWDTAVTDLTKTFRFVDDNDEDGYQYEFNRYYEVLGDDIVIRSEGLIPQNNVSKVITVGDTSTHWGEGKETPTNNIVMYTQEFIPEDEILWVDAVTVLYKALNQHEYNYQTYMAKNPSITPETSPAYQNLSNVVPDDNGLYNGYDFYMFISRNNKIEAVNAEDEPNYDYVYWSKAVREGFVNPGQDPEETILAQDFYILAEDMMMAYGEPYINDDEVKALLQVYGSDYPVQLGAQIADAWAFLKVRGCLDVPLQPTDTLNRAQLLDICTRIADEEYRSDYKVINVVLDLSDLFRDNGYYPVYDLKTTADAFQTSVVYDYKDMTEYTYLIPKTNDVNLGDVGALKVYTSPSKDDNTILKTASTNNHTLEFADNEFYVVKIPIDYTKNFYIAKTLEGAGSTNGTVDFIEVPATGLGGGIYIGGYSINNNVATLDVSSNNIVSFTEYSQDKAIVKFADYNRAERDKPVASTVSSNATTLEKISFYWDMWTSPMTAYAAEETSNSGSGIRVSLTGSDNAWTVGENSSDLKRYTNMNKFGYASNNTSKTMYLYDSECGCSSGNYLRRGTNDITKQLNRLATISEYSYLDNFIKKGMEIQ